MGEETESTRFDLYIQEIESTDDYWGPTFRAIFEGNHQTEFLKELDVRINLHDREIERLCNVYYQGFIESVRELLEVRTQDKLLNTKVSQINQKLHIAAEKAAKSSSEHLKGRQLDNNIVSAIDELKLCLPVFATYSKLQKQITEKRYYPALKTLEELEHQYLPHVAKYRFCKQLLDMIPKFRNDIEKSSMSELKDFLENIRKFSSRIGQVAMKYTSEQLRSDPTVIGRKKKRNIEPKSDDHHESDAVEEEYLGSAQELIDFSPIYRSLHISTVLKSRSKFETYYRAERSKQARLVLQPPTNMHESEESYRQYVYAVLGFFIVEDHVLNTAQGLITRAFLDEMWFMALSKIATTLQTHSAYCTDASLILRIKDIIMLFCTTLRNYGYTVKPLWELVRELRDHYTEVLMQRWVQVFREILAKENFKPIQVNNRNEYDAVFSTFPWDGETDVDDDDEYTMWPYYFPFSGMVPKIYQQVKEFIYACLKYTEDLNLSPMEVDEMIRKSMNLLLTRTFNGCLSSTFRSAHINLQDITQIIIDTGYLEQATVYLDEFISNITGEDCRSIAGSMGQSQPTLFRVSREDAIQQICEKLKQKVDEFLELEKYDWLLVEPQGHASSFITDLIAFLRTTFDSFTNLPPKVTEIACNSTCEHIAVSIFKLLMNDEIKQISMGALNQINLDLLQCEQFAASEPVQGLEEGQLLLYFTKLRQLLDLFLSDDWPTYFHDYGEETNKYKAVTPDVAIILVEKLREADKKAMFTMLKKSERDKKRLLDTVLKQLRQLSTISAK